MQTRAQRPYRTRLEAGALALLALLVPAAAAAQYSAPDARSGAIGEKYHVEVAAAFWNPDLVGLISSEQFRQIGSDINLVRDLGYERTRFKDLRIVLRPSKKSRFKIQYTPIRYEATTTLDRSIVFNGQRYDFNLPVESEFTWKVWRFGYEYDFLYLPRGFVGMLLDVRMTEFSAELNSLVNREYTVARAPLPAIGVVGRAYPLRELAVNFELSGFRLPAIDPKYEANYFDWDINGTVNITNNVGVSIGWRRLTNYMRVENDLGDLRFQGLYFGGALRY